MDLILLDDGLPDGSGLDVTRATTGVTDSGHLSQRGQETDIVVGLELEAEDYITKPFGMRELIAHPRGLAAHEFARGCRGCALDCR